MAPVKIKYLIKRKAYWYWYPRPYFKDGYKPVQLGKDEGIAVTRAIELNKALDVWRKKGEKKRAEHGTVGWLVLKYQQDDRYRDLRDNTKKTYQIFLSEVDAVFGDIPISYVTRQHARAFYAKFREQPRKADQAVTMARILFAFAYDEGLATHNPFKEMRVKKLAPREQIWQPEQLEQAIQKAEDMGYPSLALAFRLAYYTGQRAGDLRELTWNRYDGYEIKLRQSKTGSWVAVPVSATLKAALESAKKTAPSILVSEATGLPYSKDHLTKKIREVMEAAGLPEDLQFRDLRRTAVVRLAENGCTIPEISSITGHRVDDTAKILEVYMPRTSGMAASAIAKLEKGEKLKLDKKT